MAKLQKISKQHRATEQKKAADPRTDNTSKAGALSNQLILAERDALKAKFAGKSTVFKFNTTILMRLKGKILFECAEPVFDSDIYVCLRDWKGQVKTIDK